MTKLKKKISYEFDKMTTDGYSFCITPSFVLNKVEYVNKDVGYSINLAWLVWLITIKYNI